jgi:hypothetical protein
MFALCCAVPLLLAYIVVKGQWLPERTTNHGQFLSKEVYIPNWESKEHVLWTIAVSAPDECGEICDKQFSALHNLYIALGKHKDSVGLAVLNYGDANELPKEFGHYQVNETFPFANLFLVDHRGLVVLQYKYFNDEQQNRAEQKGLLKDLKKLLQYARSS